MNERQFLELYNTAIKKVAVGFYILDNCGDRLGYDKDMVLSNKKMLCEILANGIEISVTTIYADANSVQLPYGYIRELQASGLLEELIREMQILVEQEQQKITYN